MKACLIQMSCSNVLNENVRKAVQFITQAAQLSADVVCLPELFLNDEPPYTTIDVESEILETFKDLALNLNLNIVLGSVALKSSACLPTNTSFVIGRNGEIVCSYSKSHLYKTNSADFSFDETKLFSAGNEACCCEIDGVKVGIGICFDIRFPEYFKMLTDLGVEVFIIPTCLREATAKIACKVLPIARALECQTYFLSCNQTGGKGTKKKCGNSQIVRYDGIVMDKIGKKEGLICADVDIHGLHEFRKTFQLYK